MKEQVTILIPVLTDPLNADQLQALTACQQVLGDFPITYLGVNRIKTSRELLEVCPDADFATFDDHYFRDRFSLTKLLLSPELYSYFSWSRYIFLLDLDTLVMKNELSYWCRQGYDVIQLAPETCGIETTWFENLKVRFNPESFLAADIQGTSRYAALATSSLRKVATYHTLSSKRKRKIYRFLSLVPGSFRHSDALFWEYFMNRFTPEMTRPNAVGRNHFIRPFENYKDLQTSGELPFAYTGLGESNSASIIS